MAERDDLQAAIKGWTQEEPDFPLLMKAFELNYRLLGTLLNTRESQGLTQREVARRMGTSQSAIDRIEDGDVDPRLSTVQRLAVALGRIVEWKLVDPHEGVNPAFGTWGQASLNCGTIVLEMPTNDPYANLWNGMGETSTHGVAQDLGDRKSVV